MAVHLLRLPPGVVPVLVHQYTTIYPVLKPTLVLYERVWQLHGGVIRGAVPAADAFPVPIKDVFQGRFGFPGSEKCSSRSCSPSQSRKVNEGRQEEQSSIDFVSVMAQLRSLGGLPEALSEGDKRRGFMAAVEDDNLPAASSNKVPISGAPADILANIDSSLSSWSSGMRSRKVSKLLLYRGDRSRKFYLFEGEELTKAKALNLHITGLAGLRSLDNLNKTDVIWSSTKAEDMARCTFHHGGYV